MYKPRKEKTYTIIHESKEELIRPWITITLVGKNSLQNWIEQHHVCPPEDQFSIDDLRHQCDLGSCQIFEGTPASLKQPPPQLSIFEVVKRPRKNLIH